VLAPAVELEEVDFMSLLSEGNQRRLLEGSTRDAYAPGTVIFHPASEGRAYLLERGLARGYTSVPDGRQATITFFHSRELIGGTSIVSRPPAIFVQIVAKSTMTTLQLDMVRELAATENEVLAAVATHLSARIRSAYRLIGVRTLGDIRQRLAYDLLDRACRSQLMVGRLEVRATQADLADSIGSAREVVGRTLSRLRDEGVIETAPGVVRVIDPLRLAGIVRAFAI
jgi:CRP/FNR family transcriptional regulator, cyclic AMP receptor protein